MNLSVLVGFFLGVCTLGARHLDISSAKIKMKKLPAEDLLLGAQGCRRPEVTPAPCAALCGRPSGVLPLAEPGCAFLALSCHVTSPPSVILHPTSGIAGFGHVGEGGDP